MFTCLHVHSGHTKFSWKSGYMHTLFTVETSRYHLCESDVKPGPTTVETRLCDKLWDWAKGGRRTGWSPGWVSQCGVNPGVRCHRLRMRVSGETSPLSVQRFDREARVAEHTNANSPILQVERNIGGRSTEFKKTVWDWKKGARKLSWPQNTSASIGRFFLQA